MDPKTYWDISWKDSKEQTPNRFACNALPFLKKRNVRTLLDIGCGEGRDSLYFAKKGFKVTSADFSTTALSKLNVLLTKQNINTVTIIQADVKELTLNEKYDAIYAHLSLHYFDDSETRLILANLSSLLKTEGLLCIKCKATDDPLYGKGQKVAQDMYTYEGHTRHFFSKTYMTDLLKGYSLLRLRKTRSVYHGHPSVFIEAIAENK